MREDSARRPDAAREDALADRLVDFLGDVATRSIDAPCWRDARFVERRARDLAAHADPRDRWSEAEIAAATARLRGRLASVTLGVRRVDAPAPQRAAPFAGSPLAMTDAAARIHCTPLLELSAAAGEGRELWDAECESWIDLPRDVPPGRCVALTVSGDSMVPLVHAGDVILVMLGPRIASDTVIVARRPDEGYVVKRVGRIRRETVELLSLNDAYPPIAIPRDARLVVGTVVLRWCTH